MALHRHRILSAVLGVLAWSGGAFAADEDIVYTARPGDTLIGLQKQLLAAPFGWKGVMLHNRIAEPRRIPTGTQVRIPEAWLRVEARSAQVVGVHGEATLNGRPLALEDQVPPGAVLRTGNASFVTLRMPDESRLTLQPDSEARLEKIQGFAGLTGQTAQIHLERGRIENTVAVQRGPAARYRIRTPSASVSVRGTEFRVGSDGTDGRARAEVTGGEVRVGAETGPATAVAMGFGVTAEPGGGVQPPQALLPAPALEGLATVHERTAVEITLRPVDKAVAYRAQLARDAAFTDVVTEAVSPAPPVRLENVPDGRLWVRVRAIDAAGLEGFDTQRALEVRARPVPPDAAGPLAGAAFVGGPVHFEWTPVADAPGYRFQVLRRAAPEVLLIDREVVTPGIDLTLPRGEFRWRVATLKPAGGQGPWGDARALAVTRPIGVPTVRRYNDRLRFEWSGDDGQIYDFQLARDAGFGDLVVNQRLGEAAITVPVPAGGRYFVRVRGTDAQGAASPYTPVQVLCRLPLLMWTLSNAAP
ncbi:MAG TPA: FecR domain-containing protein [Rhodocyclaceae bacterium]|nr:FecR domain-containing protein [Rhodocyclaceae bacterium]